MVEYKIIVTLSSTGFKNKNNRLNKAMTVVTLAKKSNTTYSISPASPTSFFTSIGV